MPIPFILGGIALVAGAYGAKKGYDAKGDFNKAKRLNKEAKYIYDDALNALGASRDVTNEKLRFLGEMKFRAYEYIVVYIEEYNRIKNREQKKIVINTESSKEDTFKELLYDKNTKLEIETIVHGGVSALGAGGLVGLASYGAVGTFATASTGTAIAGLSGAAATNATLAWLGGGALSAGGMGMAGGAVILGSIVGGPILAIGGMILSSKAEAAKENAYTNLATAELASEEMKTAQIKTEGICKKSEELSENIDKIMQLFYDSLKQFKNVLNRKKWFFFSNTNWQAMPDEDKSIVLQTEILAITLFNLLEVDLLNSNGDIAEECNRAIESTSDFLEILQ